MHTSHLVKHKCCFGLQVDQRLAKSFAVTYVRAGECASAAAQSLRHCTRQTCTAPIHPLVRRCATQPDDVLHTSKSSPVVSATCRMMECTILLLLKRSSHCWISSGDTRLQSSQHVLQQTCPVQCFDSAPRDAVKQLTVHCPVHICLHISAAATQLDTRCLCCRRCSQLAAAATTSSASD